MPVNEVNESAYVALGDEMTPVKICTKVATP